MQPTGFAQLFELLVFYLNFHQPQIRTIKMSDKTFAATLYIKSAVPRGRKQKKEKTIYQRAGLPVSLSLSPSLYPAGKTSEANLHFKQAVVQSLSG